ncbi:MAG: thiosulfate oxidation carrier protein SoxY [Pseudomonadota bacterium]|jgi:sulfur-oxidizing protein SoxY
MMSRPASGQAPGSTGLPDLARRAFARATLALAGTMALRPAFAQPAPVPTDWNRPAFEAKTAAEAIRQLGSSAPATSRDIQIDIQDVVENGARARIEVHSRIPGTQALSILTDNNPQPLAATFTFAAGIDPYASTLLKIAESGPVRVIVQAGGRLYAATREVRVTLGGCG